jgi:hypothetical protein
MADGREGWPLRGGQSVTDSLSLSATDCGGLENVMGVIRPSRVPLRLRRSPLGALVTIARGLGPNPHSVGQQKPGRSAGRLSQSRTRCGRTANGLTLLEAGPSDGAFSAKTPAKCPADHPGHGHPSEWTKRTLEARQAGKNCDNARGGQYELGQREGKPEGAAARRRRVRHPRLTRT